MPGDPAPRRRLRHASTSCARTRRASPASRSSASTCATTRRGRLAAHLLGYVGEVDSTQLDDPRYEALEPGDQVGKEGVEYAYDSLLRGINGESRVQVDAAGQPDRRPALRARADDRQRPRADDRRRGPARPARRRSSSIGLPGGFVAMNINNGQLYGLGSSPGYDPSIFAKPRVPPAGLQAAHRRGPRRAAVRPRDPRLLSDRLDVQADHRAGGARLGRARPERDHQRHRRVRPRRRPGPPQRRRRGQRRRSTCARRSRSPPTSSSTRSAPA